VRVFVVLYLDVVFRKHRGPAFALKHVLAEKKVLFAALLLLPLAGAPLFARRMWILMAYGLAFILLATRRYLFSPYFQYSVVLFPMLFAAAARGLGDLTAGRLASALGLAPPRLFAAMGAGMLACALLTSASYGVFWPNDAFRGGFDRFHREDHPKRRARYEFIREVQRMIPPGAAVAATARIGAHFASRDRAYTMKRSRDADYLVLWNGDLREKRRERIRAIRRGGRFREVKRGHGIWVFRRRAAAGGEG